MKSKITVLLMMVFAIVFSAQAQQGQGQGQRRTPEERTKMAVTRLVDSAQISAAQQTDVTAVYMDFYKAQDKLREGLAPGTRPDRAEMDKLTEARDAKLKIILKEEQFAKLKAMEANRGNRGQGQRPPGQ